MKHDKTERLGANIIQHGKYNDRVYLIKMRGNDPKEALDQIEELAQEKQYGKIFAKVDSDVSDVFQNNSFVLEAKIPKFYKGQKDAVFYSKFLDEKRLETNEDEIQKTVEIALEQQNLDHDKDFDCRIEELTANDTGRIAEVYKQVFKTYPFPIFDEEYIKQTMQTNVRYFAAIKDDEIMAVSSSEIDYDSLNVEMTDFATLPQHRGLGCAQALLEHMNQEMQDAGIKTAYTIARSRSCGMNITFGRSGYSYAGTLVNNTNISGAIESMNVWYKSLVPKQKP